MNTIEPLTKRERQALRLLATGLSNNQIAGELSVTTGRVQNILHSIYRKLGVSNRTAAVLLGLRLGLIEAEMVWDHTRQERQG